MRNLVSSPTYMNFTYFVVSFFIFSEVSCSCVIRCKGSGGDKLLCRISATTWIALSFSIFASRYYCILCRNNLTDQYLWSGEWQELAQIIMSVVVDFLYMLNSNESICLVTVMSKKFILLFSSSSREKDNFGLMLLRLVRTTVYVGYILILDDQNIINIPKITQDLVFIKNMQGVIRFIMLYINSCKEWRGSWTHC